MLAFSWPISLAGLVSVGGILGMGESVPWEEDGFFKDESQVTRKKGSVALSPPSIIVPLSSEWAVAVL